ncbi:MAG: ParB/RepB/Spo0J family partition protein [Acidimicrobiales bacterium]|nr:ParB/RepB/Spo0J family partition protein [Acidimicrobiales bacterium]MYG89190.1 ParB/RepB/Spo0J family partition protein [Acidimicrobiales bacterium]MYI28443.1 ParB/RepB/Spo0J family partition protein [Acidimicrobiales bacterium]
MNAQRGLGRGLGALIPTGQSAYREVPVAAVEVNPLQPRQHFDTAALDTLADSIRQIGILQPIVVRETGIVGRFEIIAGERRWRAARSIGLDTIPVVVRAADDESSLTHALIENVHRADLNPLEEAAAYRQLIDDFGVTHDELGRRMGRSRATVTNSLRLLSLPVSVQRYLLDGELSAGHARALLGCDDPVELELLAERAVDEGWSVRTVEEEVRALGAPSERESKPDQPIDEPAALAPATKDRPAAVLEVESALAAALTTAVEVQLGRQGGQIVIRFADMKDLGRLYAALTDNLRG